jgi:hypothetical protein
MINPGTPKQSDGELKVWINDELKMNYKSIKIRDNNTPFNAIRIDGWYAQGAPQNQNAYIDDIIISTERIGCGGSYVSDKIPPSKPSNFTIKLQKN